MAGDKRTAALTGAWICFADETGAVQAPPKARTWGRRGITPVVRVTVGGKGRVSIAGLACYRRGARPRLMHLMRTWHGRPGEEYSLTEADFAELLDEAHRRLAAPLLLVWDSAPRHVSAKMLALIAERDWLAVWRLPGYAPDLNPVEGVWSTLKTGIGNLAPLRDTLAAIDDLATWLTGGMYRLQARQNSLLRGCLRGTGLTLKPGKP